MELLSRAPANAVDAPAKLEAANSFVAFITSSASNMLSRDKSLFVSVSCATVASNDNSNPASVWPSEDTA
eukprot:5309917-Amphidinium_carterae.1